MEPSPLTLVSTIDDLEEIARLLNEDSEFKNHQLANLLGFNLDIPHWEFLAGIDPDEVRRKPGVFERIMHAHLSDHTNGHFADAVTGIHHPDRGVFERWLYLLSERATMKDPRFQFSGHISTEMEVCGDPLAVYRSAKRTQQLISGEVWT